MKKTAKDPIREDRIHQEAIVDAYGSEEKAMSWYYLLIPAKANADSEGNANGIPGRRRTVLGA